MVGVENVESREMQGNFSDLLTVEQRWRRGPGEQCEAVSSGPSILGQCSQSSASVTEH